MIMKKKVLVLGLLMIITVLWSEKPMALKNFCTTQMVSLMGRGNTRNGHGESSYVRNQSAKPIRPALDQLASIRPGWKGEVIGISDQSFAGWEVAIGDADNDGKNEILTGGCPDSKLDMYKYSRGIWNTKTLGTNFAACYPGMVKNIKIDDLNNDGTNEIILGTGQEKEDFARLFILSTDGNVLTKKIKTQTDKAASAYTHNFGICDIDGDGVKEILSAYCWSGENYRYNVDYSLTSIRKTMIYQNSGSGEDAMITDIDHDGQPEYIQSDCFRKDAAYVRIFKFDASGNLIPYITIDGYDGHPAYQCTSTSGDIDRDGEQELIVQWKRHEDVSRQSIIAYKIKEGKAFPICTIADEDPDLDSGFSENNCYWADADNDGMNELYIGTRGEEIISNGNGYARILRFKIKSISPLSIQKEILLDFNVGIAESCWMNIGDADHDGLNEIVVATGKGSRIVRGRSYVVVLKKE